MAQPPEDQPPRQHVDEVAWMREANHQREIDVRLDWKEYYLQHPDYPGHANDNKRHGPTLSKPEPSPEIDALLEQLVSPTSLSDPDREADHMLEKRIEEHRRPETGIEELRRKAREKDRELATSPKRGGTRPRF